MKRLVFGRSAHLLSSRPSFIQGRCLTSVSSSSTEKTVQILRALKRVGDTRKLDDMLKEENIKEVSFNDWSDARQKKDIAGMISVCQSDETTPFILLQETLRKAEGPHYLDSLIHLIRKCINTGLTNPDQTRVFIITFLRQGIRYGVDQTIKDATDLLSENAEVWNKWLCQSVLDELAKAAQSKCKTRSKRLTEVMILNAQEECRDFFDMPLSQTLSQGNDEMTRESIMDIIKQKKVISPHDWVSLLRWAKNKPSEDVDGILDIWDVARVSVDQAKRYGPAAAAMTALNIRGAHSYSLVIWRDFKERARRDQLKAVQWMITPALDAICRQEGPDAALAELDLVALKRMDKISATTLLISQRPDLKDNYSVEVDKGVVQIDIKTINLLMESCLKRGQCMSHMLALWHSLDAYRLHPNDQSLGLLINASYRATISPSGSYSFRQGSYGDGFWNAAKVHKTADQIFRSIVLGPRPLVRKHLSNYPQGAIMPTLDSPHWPQFGEQVDDTTDRIVMSTASTRADLTAKHAHLIPSDRTFFYYIRLVGLLNRVDQVPLILTWMRILNVIPSYATLTAALALTDEIPLHHKANLMTTSAWTKGWGPGEGQEMLEAIQGFKEWIMDWLTCTEKQLPTSEDIASYQREVQNDWTKVQKL